MKEKAYFVCLMGVLALGTVFVSRCGMQEKKKGEEVVADSTRQNFVQKVPRDSTIYGVSDEFGMSTFTLITKSGDTISLDRDHEDGTPSKIWGDLDYDVHYALTTWDNGNSIGTLINIDQLKLYFKNYKLYNGRVLLNNTKDTIDLVSLSDERLEYKDRDGNLHKISH